MESCNIGSSSTRVNHTLYLELCIHTLPANPFARGINLGGACDRHGWQRESGAKGMPVEWQRDGASDFFYCN